MEIENFFQEELKASGKIFDGKVQYIAHDGDNGRIMHLYDLFEEGETIDTESELMSKIIDKQGSFVLQFADSDINLDQISLVDLDNLLKIRTNIVYDHLVDKSLTSIYGSFSRHDSHHIDFVSKNTLLLLQMNQISTYDLRAGLIAARLHDLGNLFSRSLHPFISVLMSEAIFPELKRYPELYNKVRLSIFIHHEPNVVKILNQSGLRGHEGEVRAIEMLDNLIGKPGLALIAADKMDIDRRRVSLMPMDRNGADTNEHIAVCLPSRYLGYELEGRRFTWRLDYDLYMDETDTLTYPYFVNNLEDRTCYISKLLFNSSNDVFSDPFKSWQKLFWRIFSDRNKVFTLSIFAMFSEVDEVCISMRNKKNSFTENYIILHPSKGLSMQEQFDRFSK